MLLLLKERPRSIIFRIRNINNVWITDYNDIAKMAVNFYKDQFTTFHHSFDFPLIERFIPHLIYEGDFKKVVFNMNLNGAAGLDGFNGKLYVH